MDRNWAGHTDFKLHSFLFELEVCEVVKSVRSFAYLHKNELA